MTKQKTTVGLLVSGIVRQDEYVHFKAWPVVLDTEERGSVYHVTYSDPINGLYLNNLVVHSQGNNNDAERRLYGFEVRYMDLHCVGPREATAMAKTFGVIAKRLEKLTEVRGYARSYGEYIGRAAEALGATQILRRRDGDHRDFQRLNLGDGTSMIDMMVREWVNERQQAVA